ncbi:MAG: Acyl-CoA dehydrogenase, short-chain specific, partial [uncultured Frankineae bacterium]
ERRRPLVLPLRPDRGALAAPQERPAAGRGQDRAPCGGDRRDGRVPVGRPRGAQARRPARAARPRAVRRRGRRPHRALDRRRGDRPGVRLELADPGRQQAGDHGADPVGLRGAQAGVPSRGRLRRGDLLLRAVRAGGRQRRGGDEDPRGARRRRVRPERHEVLDHGRRRQHALHGHGGHRPRQGRERHQCVRGPGRRPRVLGRHQGAQARHQGLADLRDLLRGLPHPGVPADRRRGHGLQDRPEDPRPHPVDDRRAGGRHRAGRARRGRGLHQGAPAVRQEHRRLPGRAVHARRHGDEGGGRAPARLRRERQRRAGRSRPDVPVERVEDVRLRHRDVGDDRRGPAVRRLRLHQGLPRRADDARREDHADLRGHQPGPAHGDGAADPEV